MSTGLDVLNIARTQIGFVEGPNNENPYGIWYGIPNASYCAMGVSWCFAQVGLSSLIAAQTPKGFSYCPAGLTWFQKQNLVINKYAGQPGDLIFYSFEGNGVADHVEILEAASPAGLTTIGFNTSPDHATGSQQNGGGCYRRHRNYLYVLAIVRPRYPVIVKPTVAPSTSKKATAVVGGTGAAVAGATGMLHTGPTNVSPTPSKSPTVFVAPPFPTNPKSFDIGQTNDAVMTVEKALAKAGLLPNKYVDGTMDNQTVDALTKFEKKNGISVPKGSVPQIVYDTLKAKL